MEGTYRGFLQGAVVCLAVAVVAAATVATGGAAALAAGGVISSAAAVSAIGSVALTSSAALTGAALISSTAASIQYIKPEPMRPKGSRSKNDKTPGNNQAQNKQFNDVCRELKLSDDQCRILHQKISGRGYGYSEIRGIAKTLFR